MNQNRASKYFPVQPDRPLGFCMYRSEKLKILGEKGDKLNIRIVMAG